VEPVVETAGGRDEDVHWDGIVGGGGR